MWLFVNFLYLLSILNFSLANDEVNDEDSPIIEERELVTDPNFVPTPEKPFNFIIDYNIAFKEDISSGLIDDLINGETIELLYNFKNLEPQDVSIVGVGGQMIDPVTGEIMANITASQIGPIEVTNNVTTPFTQRVGINMPIGNFLLVPAIYVVYQEQFMLLGSKNKLINVIEPTISIFNPKLIISEIILIVSTFAIGYYIYITFAGKYLSNILPESLLPSNPKKKSVSSSSSTTSTTSSTTNSPSPSLDSWLPESHKSISKKKKKN